MDFDLTEEQRIMAQTVRHCRVQKGEKANPVLSIRPSSLDQRKEVYDHLIGRRMGKY